MNTVNKQTATPLRELPADQFEAKYDCDRFTSTVLSNRFRYVLHHACTHLLTNAFSPILRDYYDFSASISAPEELDFAVPAVAQTISIFFGSMREAVANTVREFGQENLKPGDVLISNDPYRNGTHVNDMCFLKPIFSGDKLVSILTIRAHMMDMGGIVPGGFSGLEKNIYETGLVLPPMLLFSDYKPVRSTFSLIMDNVRFGKVILPDLYAIEAALCLGENLLSDSVQKYGEPAYLGAIRYACDASANAMQDAISTIPDGTYEGEDFIDCDGEDSLPAYRVAVKIRKFGQKMEVDLSGTSSQARTSINAAWPDVKSAVATVLKLMIDPHTPYTSSSLRDVDIVLPLGTIASAVPPDGPVFSYWEPFNALLLAMMKALNLGLGENGVAGANPNLNHSASGVDEQGQPWVSVSLCGGQVGGWGATRTNDGDSGQAGYYMNMLDAAIEAIESDTPVVLMRREYAADTGGPGIHRGGTGIIKDSYWLTDSLAHCIAPHVQSANGFGVNNGKDGGHAGVWMWPADEANDINADPFLAVSNTDSLYAQARPIAGVFDPHTQQHSETGQYFYWGQHKEGLNTPAKSTWRYLSSGGGGWGNPLQRDPNRVVKDVRDGYVSIDGAANDYGVVVLGNAAEDPEGLRFDKTATAQLRQTLSSDTSFQTHRNSPSPSYETVAPALHVERQQVDGSCTQCGNDQLAKYPVLGEGGWFNTIKCQHCLTEVHRSPSTHTELIPVSRFVLHGDAAQ